jgi:uncharacterized SAM-binding protein YcdF (DUF218 family)
MGPGRVPEQAALTPPAPPRRRGRRWLWRLGVLAVLLGLVYFLHPLLLPWAARWLDVSETPQPVDEVLVLGGEANIRPFVAAALYNAGLTKRVLVPAVKQSPSARDAGRLPEQELIRRVLVKRGVPDEAIVLLPDVVDSTADEAAALRHYLEDKPERTVAVVTTCYHTRRVRWIFRKQLGARAEQLHFVAGPTDGYDASNWWRSEEGCQRYVNEYLKLAFYWANY